MIFGVLDSNQCSVRSIVAARPWSGLAARFALTNSGRFRLWRTAHWADASFVCPVDVSHLGLTGSETGAAHEKTHPLGVGFPVWSVLDSNQVSLRFACSVKFAIVALLRCRLHDLLLTTLPPRFICHWQRFGSAPNRCA